MKVKKVEIAIKGLDDALNETAGIYESLSSGKKLRKKEVLYFSGIRDFRKALTEKRLEILKIIREKKPSSIYALAKLTGRNLKNVIQDVEYLHRIGLLELKRTTEGRGENTPVVNYERIRLEIYV
ncbi:MAG TPA: hypothetical protein ENI58_01055 [Nitrospirae bacterium]|nr:hypothetical protein [Nitrospirota bacterium]